MFDGMRRNLGAFGTAAVAAGAVAAGALALIGKSAIDAAADAQRVATQTDAVLASTRGAAGLTAAAVADLATQLSRVTPFEDEAVQGAENMLLTFTQIGRDVFPRATEAVLDMSQAFGQDLQSSAVQLGKALQDPIAGVTALRRVGVNLTDAQQAMIRGFVDTNQLAKAQAIILDELAVEFGGAARAAGTTFAGQLAILQTSLGNILEAIGGPLVGALNGALQALNPLVQGFADALPAAIETVMPLLGSLGEAALGAFAWARENIWEPFVSRAAQIFDWLMGTVLPTITPIAQQAFDWILNTAWPTLRTNAEAVFGWLVNEALPAVGLAATAAFSFMTGPVWQLILQLAQPVLDWLSGPAWADVRAAAAPVLDWIGQSLTWLAGQVLPTFAAGVELGRQALAAVQPVIDYLGPKVIDLGNALLGVADAIAGQVVAVVESLNVSLGQSGLTVQDVANAIGSVLVFAVGTLLDQLTTLATFTSQVVIPVFGTALVGAVNLAGTALNGLATLVRDVAAIWRADDLADVLNANGRLFADFANVTQDLLRGFLAALGAIMATVADYLLPGWRTAWNAVGQVVADVLASIAATVQVNLARYSAVFEVFGAAVQRALAGDFVGAWELARQAASNVGFEIVRVTAENFLAVGEEAQRGGRGIVSGFLAGWRDLVPSFEPALVEVDDMIARHSRGWAQSVGDAGDMISRHADGVVQATQVAAASFQAPTAAARQMATGVGTSMQQVATTSERAAERTVAAAQTMAAAMAQFVPGGSLFGGGAHTPNQAERDAFAQAAAGAVDITSRVRRYEPWQLANTAAARAATQAAARAATQAAARASETIDYGRDVLGGLLDLENRVFGGRGSGVEFDAGTTPEQARNIVMAALRSRGVSAAEISAAARTTNVTVNVQGSVYGVNDLKRTVETGLRDGSIKAPGLLGR